MTAITGCRRRVCPSSEGIEACSSARGRARADAQGRCDGAGSGEIGYQNPPALHRAGGFSVCPSASVFSLFLRWSLRAEALGIKTRRSPAGRSKFFAFCWAGIPELPTRASILSHSMATHLFPTADLPISAASKPRNSTENSMRFSRGKIVTRYTEAVPILPRCPDFLRQSDAWNALDLIRSESPFHTLSRRYPSTLKRILGLQFRTDVWR